ncbi:MAG: hypothetical protein ACOVLC_11600 [Flavobacterium sp.]
MFKLKFLYIFIYLSSFFIFGQELKGIVFDESSAPIHLANVQLLHNETEQLISYTQTNDQGAFLFNIENVAFPYNIKITHISFEKQEQLISNFNPLKIILKTRVTALEEVILESESPDVIEKEDTLVYNLKKLLVGSELKLKDIINKLPGLSIDQHGKILYNGNKIDNILLDGDEFFRDNHQLATEHITAEMIEKIELLTNYQDLSSIKGFENSGQTALNVSLKKSFREMFKGSFEAEGGVKERYKLQSNLFNFGSKNKFNLITNANNLNENIFSTQDYVDLRKTTGRNLIKDKLISGREASLLEELPPFVFSQDNINGINAQNASLNFARKPTPNKRLEFVSVLNKTNLAEKNTRLLTFLDGESSDLLDEYTSFGSSLYAFNVFKFENKLSEKSYFQTNAYLFLSLDDQAQDLNNLVVNDETQTLFQNKTTLNSLKNGFNTQYKTKFSDKFLFEAVLFNDYSFAKSAKDYQSNRDFIGFGLNDTQLIQNTNHELFSLGIKAKASLKLKKSSLDLKFVSTLDNESLSNDNNISSSYLFEDHFSLVSHTMSLNFLSDREKKFKYAVNLSFVNNHHLVRDNFEETINILLPKINLSYRLSKNSSYSIGYTAQLDNPNLYHFTSGNLVKDQRTILRNSNLVSEPLLSDIFNSGLSFFDLSKSLFANFFISYTENRKQLVLNSNNDNLVSIQDYQYLNFGNTWTSADFSRKFQKIPLGFNFSSSSSLSNNKILSENIINNNKFIQNNASFSLNSYFKNKPNFRLGINYLSNFNQLETILGKDESRLQTFSPFLNLEGTFLNKKWNWRINTTKHIFEATNFTSDNILDVSGKLNFLANEKTKIYLNVNNVLNIRENNFKNNFSQSEFMIQEIKMNTLSGFINMGLNYSF